MIHWFAFNLMVIIVAASLVLNIRNELTLVLGWILIVVAILLMIKDFIVMQHG